MAGSPSLATWPVEDIPNGDSLFYCVHVSLVPQRVPVPGIFAEKGSSLSTDWEKYATPEQARNYRKEPSKNGIVRLQAGAVRSIDGLAARHAPDYERQNRAHSEVLGISTPVSPVEPGSPYAGLPSRVRKTRVRLKLLELCGGTWVIDPFA